MPAALIKNSKITNKSKIRVRNKIISNKNNK